MQLQLLNFSEWSNTTSISILRTAGFLSSTNTLNYQALYCSGPGKSGLAVSEFLQIAQLIGLPKSELHTTTFLCPIQKNRKETMVVVAMAGSDSDLQCPPPSAGQVCSQQKVLRSGLIVLQLEMITALLPGLKQFCHQSCGTAVVKQLCDPYEAPDTQFGHI